MTQPTLEGVPPGPGARPPFVAAPTEGSTTRLWWGLGTGAAALLLFCGGGIALLVGLAITGVRAVEDQANQTVTRYLDALERGKPAEAYDLVCEEMRKRYDLDEFQALERDVTTSTGYTLGEVDLNTLQMPVQLEYASGPDRSVTYQLTQNSSTGHIEICGTA
ncbi:MAG: hypothetical protein HOV71_14975 [Hamadaea sp.]|uniref:Rv0361 family membrane protein n=1 Tax=Hamadaea sp. NPDC050747 TaxID=3155789 RepID=UPI0018509653|nr:hypothetical protein [Hamadaea sp.]NUR49432.1 hypothetical protein [Hamadaea sp.]NUT02559.1 hypothetical protein [Hamadaea sp.]